jgi:uncharacterized protein YggU (UPF0235/DUF167 family)
MATVPWREVPECLVVTPRGGRDAVDGSDLLADGKAVLKVRVRSALEDGAPNEAVRRLLAATLGRRASAVTLTSGAASRLKTHAVRGEPASLAAALAQSCAPGAAGR